MRLGDSVIILDNHLSNLINGKTGIITDIEVEEDDYEYDEDEEEDDYEPIEIYTVTLDEPALVSGMEFNHVYVEEDCLSLTPRNAPKIELECGIYEHI